MLSVAEQIEDLWFPDYASQPSYASWSGDNTLFAIFDGINDVGDSYYKGVPATTVLNGEIFAVYHGIVDELYFAGARNFAFLNCPPVNRSPLTTAEGASAAAEQMADIEAWNAGIITMATSLKSTYPDVNVFTVDVNALFNQILDDPASFPQTALYKNTTTYCVAYEK